VLQIRAVLVWAFLVQMVGLHLVAGLKKFGVVKFDVDLPAQRRATCRPISQPNRGQSHRPVLAQQYCATFPSAGAPWAGEGVFRSMFPTSAAARG